MGLKILPFSQVLRQCQWCCQGPTTGTSGLRQGPWTEGGLFERREDGRKDRTPLESIHPVICAAATSSYQISRLPVPLQPYHQHSFLTHTQLTTEHDSWDWSGTSKPLLVPLS